ncbi:ribonuclease P protein component [Pseudochelatococcus lubricantis]|uniref:Ribonuclease P protein component n=1 Tax=Pseudochelatococcus lubricantis TaxID=1538102 RepID=A0ABX0UZY5_9HYPH|nr:ribonuclease P protein component [Pseudochelatococcus lubricantis]NIJ57450.1 ribonuclease P protein component [Pseudochelatococcus lubricantis]
MNETEQSASGRRSSRLPRLLKRAEFLTAASGRRVHSSRMTVQIHERSSEAPGDSGVSVPVCSRVPVSGPRFGLTVTKKTANAVGRNRIRRRLRAALQDVRAFWPNADIDFVIVGRGELLTAPMDIIASDLKRAFSSPPRQGNPLGRDGRPSHRRRGKATDRPHGTIQRNPTDHS